MGAPGRGRGVQTYRYRHLVGKIKDSDSPTTHPRATSQTDDTRYDQLSGGMDHYAKEPLDVPILKPQVHAEAVGDDRGWSVGAWDKTVLRGHH